MKLKGKGGMDETELHVIISPPITPAQEKKPKQSSSSLALLSRKDLIFRILTQPFDSNLLGKVEFL